MIDRGPRLVIDTTNPSDPHVRVDSAAGKAAEVLFRGPGAVVLWSLTSFALGLTIGLLW